MTNLPWDIISDPESPVELYTLVVDAKGEAVADCGIVGRSDEENEAAARLIVERVNAALASPVGAPTEAGDGDEALRDALDRQLEKIRRQLEELRVSILLKERSDRDERIRRLEEGLRSIQRMTYSLFPAWMSRAARVNAIARRTLEKPPRNKDRS